ncbi:hypothetical protein WH5701_07516 [Synechococcus sp. WH 5701]|nr:hypothetical protein WH5701_07516 [Synechococcus sp. WH 5701]
MVPILHPAIQGAVAADDHPVLLSGHPQKGVVPQLDQPHRRMVGCAPPGVQDLEILIAIHIDPCCSLPVIHRLPCWRLSAKGAGRRLHSPDREQPPGLPVAL